MLHVLQSFTPRGRHKATPRAKSSPKNRATRDNFVEDEVDFFAPTSEAVEDAQWDSFALFTPSNRLAIGTAYEEMDRSPVFSVRMFEESRAADSVTTPIRPQPSPGSNRDMAFRNEQDREGEQREYTPVNEKETSDDDYFTAAQYSFRRFVKHRWNGNAIEIEVEWDEGSLTWEPESVLHADARDTLLKYWAAQGGRPTNPNDADLYDIFAILRHKPDRKCLLVEWTGYGPEHRTWVLSASVEETAPELVAEYWASLQPRPRGRPRKRRRGRRRDMSQPASDA